MRKARAQLALAAQARGAHHAAGRQHGQVLILIRDKRIVRVFALADSGQYETFRHVHWHILQRMHGKIGAAVFQRGFQLFHEQSLAADF